MGFIGIGQMKLRRRSLWIASEPPFGVADDGAAGQADLTRTRGAMELAASPPLRVPARFQHDLSVEPCADYGDDQAGRRPQVSRWAGDTGKNELHKDPFYRDSLRIPLA